MCSCFCFGKNSVYPVEKNNALKNYNMNEDDLIKKMDQPKNESVKLDFRLFQSKVSEGNMRVVVQENGKGESPKKINIHEKTKYDTKQKTFYELKDKFTCLLCGGKSCKHEDWTLHKNPAIKGLNSDQINNNIYASQRLSNRLIEEYNLIQQFIKYMIKLSRLNIGLVVNLQLQGEHPYCGDKLDPSTGFSYDPQYLISENIRYKNYGWKDMSIPDSINFMLDIVKDMGVTIRDEKKNVLVHCHAGYGRTGVVIACYLLFENNYSLNQVVKFIRSKRSECIQKKQQLEFCNKFKEYIDHARILYTPIRMNIDSFMKNQNDMIFGKEIKDYEFVPKLLDVIFKRIIEIKKKNLLSNHTIYKFLYCLQEWTNEKENYLVRYKLKLNENDWHIIDTIDHIPTLVVLLYDWLEDCVYFLIPPEKIISFFSKGIKEEDLRSAIDNFKDLEPTVKRLYTSKLKRHFRLVEFEMLICLTCFISEIEPDEDNSSRFLYDRMLERIILLFSGIKLDSIKYEINLNETGPLHSNIPKEIIILFRRFKLIHEFFSLIINSNSQDENFSGVMCIDTVHSSKNQSEINEFSPYLKNKSITSGCYLNSPFKRKFSVASNMSNNNKVNIDFLKGLDINEEKEQCMAFVYNFLDQYFKVKTKHKFSNTMAPDTFNVIEKNKTHTEGFANLNESILSSSNVSYIKNNNSNMYKQHINGFNDFLEVIDKFKTIFNKDQTKTLKSKGSENFKTQSSYTQDITIKGITNTEITHESETSEEIRKKKSKKNIIKLESIKEEDKKDIYSDGGNTFLSKKSLHWDIYEKNHNSLKEYKEIDFITKDQVSFRLYKELSNLSKGSKNNDKKRNQSLNAKEIYSHEFFKLPVKTPKTITKSLECKENRLIEKGPKIQIDLEKIKSFNFEMKDHFSPIIDNEINCYRSSDKIFLFKSEFFEQFREEKLKEVPSTLKAKQRKIDFTTYEGK